MSWGEDFAHDLQALDVLPEVRLAVLFHLSSRCQTRSGQEAPR